MRNAEKYVPTSVAQNRLLPAKHSAKSPSGCISDDQGSQCENMVMALPRHAAVKSTNRPSTLASFLECADIQENGSIPFSSQISRIQL